MLLVLLCFLFPSFTPASARDDSRRTVVAPPAVVQIAAAHTAPKGKGKVETAALVAFGLSGWLSLDAADGPGSVPVKVRALEQKQCGPSRAPPSTLAA